MSRVDPWMDRWDRLVDLVAMRWYRFMDRWAERRSRVAMRWYRFMDRWAERRSRVAMRWYRFMDRRAARSGAWGSSRIGRSAVVAIACLVTISIFTTIVLAMNVPDQGTQARSNIAQRPPTGIPVPDVRGDSASAARRALIDAGLTLERVEAAVGEPGRVFGTSPPIGRLVEPGTPVTLIVGVESERALAVPPGD
jgi:hypothetical protein